MLLVETRLLEAFDPPYDHCELKWLPVGTGRRRMPTGSWLRPLSARIGTVFAVIETRYVNPSRDGFTPFRSAAPLFVSIPKRKEEATGARLSSDTARLLR